jgi:hypothetical protein
MHCAGSQNADAGQDGSSGHAETYAVACHRCGADPTARPPAHKT